jgi:hypothetical protein
MIGETFNRWTVLALARNDSGKLFYLCRCVCGTERQVRKDQLVRNVSKSCGCWKAEVAKEQITRLSTKHGLANKSPTYAVWKGMRKRCFNPSDLGYKNYGGRGISVCQRWDDYALFLADMGEVPNGMMIDRKDNNGNYEPSNCRWTDKKTQANNTRSNVFIKYDGELRTVKQWAEKLGIPYHMLYQRLFRLGWGVEKSFRTPKQKN